MNTHKMPRFSARKKNRDNMLLLVSDPAFKKLVADIRHSFEIPPEGFKTDSTYDRWLSKNAEIYEKLTDPEKRSGSAFMGFMRTPRLVIEEYNLPEHYTEHIRKHILFGTITAPLNNFNIGPFPIDVHPNKVRHIPVRIFGPLTDDEFADLKKEVNRMSRHLPSYQPLKNVEGKITSEKKVAERDAQNSAHDHSGRPFSLAEMAEGEEKKVYADIRELKDLRKKRFGK